MTIFSKRTLALAGLGAVAQIVVGKDDGHHGPAGDVLVELAIDRRTEPRRHAVSHDLDDGAGRGARFSHLVEELGPDFDRLGIGTEERVTLDLVPLPIGAVDLVRSDLDQRAAHAYAGNDLAGDSAGRHAVCRLTRRRAARASPVAHAVFHEISVVGVAGTELV